MYVIREWRRRYEVNEKGHPARPGDKLRMSQLLYIRSKIHGYAQSSGFYAIQRLAKGRAYEVFGVFHKLLEIAGCSEPDKRGIILNHKGEPASTWDLSHILREQKEVIEYALSVLANEAVLWILDIPSDKFSDLIRARGVVYDEKVDELWKTCEIPGEGAKFDDSGNSRNTQSPTDQEVTEQPKFPEPTTPGPLYNETKRNETKHKLSKTKQGAIPGELPKLTGHNGHETPSGDGENFDNFNPDSVSTSTRPDNSTRLAFGHGLRTILGVKNTSDTTALWNLQSWADRQPNTVELYERIGTIAKDCRNGRNPIAVFFSRVDQELGYRARNEAQKGRI